MSNYNLGAIYSSVPNCPFHYVGAKLSVFTKLMPNCPLSNCPTTHKSATKRNWSKNCVADDTFILLGKIAQRQPSLFLSRPHHFIFALKLSFIPLFTWCYKNPTSLTALDDFLREFCKKMLIRHSFLLDDGGTSLLENLFSGLLSESGEEQCNSVGDFSYIFWIIICSYKVEIISILS